MKKFLGITKKAALVILTCMQAVAVMGSLLMVAGFLYVDYFRKPHNQKADDEISRAVYEAVGAKEIYYQGKSEDRAGTTTYYSFYVTEEKEGLVQEAVEAVNAVLEQEKRNDKISISFFEGNDSEGSNTLLILRNYHDDYGESADYGQLQYLRIIGNAWHPESIYNVPETYQSFQEIKHLEISYRILQAAQKEGVDWHEYWSELETIEVISR